MLLDPSTLNSSKFTTLSCKIAGRDAKFMAALAVMIWLQICEKGHVSKVGLAAQPLRKHGKALRLALLKVSFPRKSGFVTKCVYLDAHKECW